MKYSVAHARLPADLVKNRIFISIKFIRVGDVQLHRDAGILAAAKKSWSTNRPRLFENKLWNPPRYYESFNSTHTGLVKEAQMERRNGCST